MLTLCVYFIPQKSASCLIGNITTVRTQQRCVLSPIIFYIVVEKIAKQLGKRKKLEV